MELEVLTMTRTKAGKAKRAKAFFEDECVFVPKIGEVVLTYSEVSCQYHLFTEAEWEACGRDGSGSRLTADIYGRVFNDGKMTAARIPKRLRVLAF
jgi:hypothetical protein